MRNRQNSKSFFQLNKWSLSTCGFFLLIMFSSCKKEGIVYYEVPKDEMKETTALPQGHPPVGKQEMSSPEPVSSNLAWSKPAEWDEAENSSMRFASYVVHGLSRDAVDISITRFPGDVGGLFSNVNRWRGQLGMSRLMDPSELVQDVQPIQTEHFKLHVVSLVNDADVPKAMKVAVLDLDGFTWFFKMMGEQDFLDEQTKVFDKFVRSISKREVQK